jgi:hypothetical protein
VVEVAHAVDVMRWSALVPLRWQLPWKRNTRRIDEHERRFDALFSMMAQNYRDAGERPPAGLSGELPTTPMPVLRCVRDEESG